jgi:hypothetical protein
MSTKIWQHADALLAAIDSASTAPELEPGERARKRLEWVWSFGPEQWAMLAEAAGIPAPTPTPTERALVFGMLEERLQKVAPTDAERRDTERAIPLEVDPSVYAEPGKP